MCLVVMAACDTSSNIAPPDYFMKLYGHDGNQFGVDLVPLDDGSYMLLGYTVLNNSSRIYLVNVDAEGRTKWDKTLGGFSEIAVDLERTNDGNLVILSSFLNVDNRDVKLIRVRPDGTKIDSVTHGSPMDDNPKTVTPLSDGGFIITGETKFNEDDFDEGGPEGATNSLHYRCDANLVFDPNWTEYYGDQGRLDGATKTFEAQPDFYVFGWSNKPHEGKPVNDLHIHLQYYPLGSLGVPTGKDTFLGEVGDNTTSRCAIQAPGELGGGFLIFATKETTPGITTIHVSRLRSPISFIRTADELFDESISIDGRLLEAVSASAATVDSRGFLLLSNEVRATGARNIFLTKINQSAVPEWSVSLGSEEEDDQAGNVLELSDGRIMVIGTVEIGDNQRKMALFKLNSAGRLQQ